MVPCAMGMAVMGLGFTMGMGSTMSLCFRPAKKKEGGEEGNDDNDDDGDDGRKSRFVDRWLSRR